MSSNLKEGKFMERIKLAMIGLAVMAVSAAGVEEDAVRIYREVQGCVVTLEHHSNSGAPPFASRWR